MGAWFTKDSTKENLVKWLQDSRIEDILQKFEAIERRQDGSALLDAELVDDIKRMLEELTDLQQTKHKTPPKTSQGDYFKTMNTEERFVSEVAVVNPLTSGATTEFVLALRSQLKDYNIGLTDTTLEEFSADTGTHSVMLICNNHSRSLADVTNTLSKIEPRLLKRVFLVVVHCRNENKLPQVPTKSELEHCEEFKEIRNVVDMAFSNISGNPSLYNCDMNTNAIVTIRRYVKEGELRKRKLE